MVLKLDIRLTLRTNFLKVLRKSRKLEKYLIAFRAKIRKINQGQGKKYSKKKVKNKMRAINHILSFLLNQFKSKKIHKKSLIKVLLQKRAK